MKTVFCALLILGLAPAGNALADIFLLQVRDLQNGGPVKMMTCGKENKPCFLTLAYNPKQENLEENI